MGSIRHPEKVKLIVGLLFSDLQTYAKTKKYLEHKYGRADFESDILDFTHTSYYAVEMGTQLKRRFLSFEKPVSFTNICEVKIRTNKLEKHFMVSGKRTINIDPGYLNLSKVVLLSTKDYTHRIYVGKGIFAEVTLFFQDDEFNPWPWTYPDYKTEEYMVIFKSIRQIYKTQGKSGLMAG